MADTGLAAALVKFQGSGFAVPRTRTVEVETKSGGKYTFAYAPHELIVAAVRKPLEDNGLAVSQTLSITTDGRPALRTILLHSSGERIEDVFPLPLKDGMTAQELGSAITYIRRYALSAILGLATEDDDDGNRASGNRVVGRTDAQPRPEPPPRPVSHEPTNDGGLIGMAQTGDAPADYELRESPEGWSLSFKLMDGRKGFRVVASDGLAQALSLIREDVIGKRVTCWGRMGTASFTKGGQKVTYNVLELERIQTPDVALPIEIVVPDTIPLGLTPEQDDELDRILV